MEDEFGSAAPQYKPESDTGARGFFGSLFDLEFTSFVTPKIIKILFIIALVLAAFGTLAVIIGAFQGGAAIGILALIFSPVIFMVSVLFSRIYLELVMVFFRIYEVLRDRPV